MRAALLALALALPSGALAHDPSAEVAFNPGFAWFVAPGNPTGADGRIRVVVEPSHGRAALTLNQVDAYQRAYRRHLGRLAMRMPLRSAEARAHHAAWHETIDGAARIGVPRLDLRPLHPGEVPTVVLP